MKVIKYREHELPVAWDGEPVTWSDEPTAVGGVFICPPPRIPDACTACGQLSGDGADAYVGCTWETEPAHWSRDERTGKPRKYPARQVRHPRLVLTRCLGCGHDRVADLDSGEEWDLDETDYGPEGSWAGDPQLFPDPRHAADPRD